MAITEEIRAQIRRLFYVDHFKVNSICEALYLHPDTVKRAIGSEKFANRRRGSQLLKDYEDLISDYLDLYPKVTGARLFQIMLDRDYKGSVSLLTKYLHKERPKYKRAYIRMKTFAGEQAQADWSYCKSILVGKTKRKLYLFVMTLSYSRGIFVKFCLDMKLATFLQCHEDAFQYFGGVPKIILYDNLKSVVIDRIGKSIRFNEEFLKFSSYYLFEPRPCNVYRGNEKGKVERSIQYFKVNFLSARPTTSFEKINEQAFNWRDNIANKRSWPDDRSKKVFAKLKEEQKSLIKLPANPMNFRGVLPRKIGKTPWLTFDNNAYSVPETCVGQLLIVSYNHDEIQFILESKVVASHKRCWEKNRFIEDKSHRMDISKHDNFGRTSIFRNEIQTAFPQSKYILEESLKANLSLHSVVRQLFNLCYLYGDEKFSRALAKANTEKRFTIESIQIFLQQLDTKNTTLPIRPNLESKPELAEFTVSQRNLADYDNI